MAAKHRLMIVAVLAAAAGLGYAAFDFYGGRPTEPCSACRRVVHAHTRTVATVDGKPRVFCCPACALSEHHQEGRPIRITELTAFLTGAKLSPAGAFLVKGSDLNTCARAQGLIDEEKRPIDIRFDRCAPSLLAFGRRSEAIEFTRAHGGEVLAFAEIAGAFAH